MAGHQLLFDTDMASSTESRMLAGADAQTAQGNQVAAQGATYAAAMTGGAIAGTRMEFNSQTLRGGADKLANNNMTEQAGGVRQGSGTIEQVSGDAAGVASAAAPDYVL